jgi:glycine/D-amino acid oxidase-like deaminating enzyme
MLTTPLRTGRTPWSSDAIAQAQAPDEVASPIQTDILIVGAGITGAFLAEVFSRTDKSIVVVDRHQPETASTMASSALLLWEIDAPLSELSARLGFEKAAQVYQSSVQTVQYIAALANELNLHCAFTPRHTLYLEGDKLSGPAFREEFVLRKKAGLPCTFFEAADVVKQYGFPPRAAMRSNGNAEANPVMLARELLLAAIRRGAKVISPVSATNYNFEDGKVYARTDKGLEVIAHTLLLATGYEMPAFVQAARHKIVSTYAICTVPQNLNALWPGRDLVWEASESYLYMRTTPDRRILIGGEDEEIANAAKRDALMPQKAKALQNKLHRLLPHVDTALDYQWSAFFGVTEDSLPLIGRVPGLPNAYAAYGYGGNGITFSALAAQILRDEILGLESEIPAKELFTLDRV